MQWLQKFMMGRYGADQLNLALIVLALVLSIVFSIVPLGLIVVRMLSRNRTKRAQENLAFLKLWNPVRNWFQWLYLSIRYCKKNRYFLCPNCGRIACVPKKTGRVTITCKGCKTRYDRKA